MNNTYYLAQIVEEIDNVYDDYIFVGVFTTYKNAEDGICKALSRMYNETVDYTDYSAEENFLDKHAHEYMITKIVTDKIYY